MTDLQRQTDREPTRWDPFANLENLRRQFDEITAQWPLRLGTGDVSFVPRADVEETDDAWIIDVELPGVSRDDVEVEVHGRTVVIHGDRKEKTRDGILRQKTRVMGTFRYEVSLPGDFDPDAVIAKLEDGELTVTLPKTEADQPRKISIA
jgi:HSP20 family protein